MKQAMCEEESTENKCGKDYDYEYEHPLGPVRSILNIKQSKNVIEQTRNQQ